MTPEQIAQPIADKIVAQIRAVGDLSPVVRAAVWSAIREEICTECGDDQPCHCWNDE